MADEQTVREKLEQLRTPGTLLEDGLFLLADEIDEINMKQKTLLDTLEVVVDKMIKDNSDEEK